MINCIGGSRSIYLYKIDLALNNQQWLICHKTKANNFVFQKDQIFQMILPIASWVSVRRMLISLSVDEILLLRYGKWSTRFRGLTHKVKMAPYGLF